MKRSDVHEPSSSSNTPKKRPRASSDASTDENTPGEVELCIGVLALQGAFKEHAKMLEQTTTTAHTGVSSHATSSSPPACTREACGKCPESARETTRGLLTSLSRTTRGTRRPPGARGAPRDREPPATESLPLRFTDPPRHRTCTWQTND